mmetsp:Transcript_14792/g.40477  ORF Transcript_14792/g.40477 Transcript_14792/m.40477 type:complete len:213 (-) Transcript_14792:755-1393(-)
MYRTCTVLLRAANHDLVVSLRKWPTSGSFLLPDASVPRSTPAKCSCPAPSATTMRQWPRVSSSLATWPMSRSTSNSTSGSRQMSTSLAARVACMATKPHSRPMTLTMPTPLTQSAASTCAQLMTLTASSTAVSNPKDLSMKAMSLSMVLGTPHTDMGILRLRRAPSTPEPGLSPPRAVDAWRPLGRWRSRRGACRRLRSRTPGSRPCPPAPS